MRITRFRAAAGGPAGYGLIEGETDELVVLPLEGPPYDGVRQVGGALTRDEVVLLVPVEPSKVLAFGRNYAKHAKELGNEVPETPVEFSKPSTAVVGDGQEVAYPALTRDLHFEGELAVVIGRRCKDVLREQVADVVLGYTVGNDLTMRDLQRAEKQWTRAKGFDGSCPLGPWVETDVDPSALSLRTTVNGVLRQDGTTADMLLDVADCVAFVSQAMTLLPGDVVLTGTPAGVGALQVGDEVSVTVEGIGTLTNRIVRDDAG